MQKMIALVGAMVVASTFGVASAQSDRTQVARPKQGIKHSKVAAKDSNQKDGVRALFRDAMRLYIDRKYDESLLAFDRILRKYPEHQPSIIHMAKVFYRLDRIPESHRLFTRINPVTLDIETSYEYALSHFWMQQYQQALYGFQRVPQGHSLFDLANYYGGISALKLRRLVEAEAMIDKAVVLPAKLAESRKNYQRHIQEMKLIYEKRGLAEERARERKQIEAQIRTEKPVRLSAKDHPNIQEEEKYKHAGFEEVETAPEFGLLFKNQVVDYHGYAEEVAKLRTGYFQFSGGPLIPLPLKVNKDQAAIGLQIVLRAEEQEREGIERRNVQVDDTDDIQRILTTDPGKKNSKFGTLTLQPWIEVPTKLNMWVAVGGKLSLRYPDFERSDMSSTRAGYLRLGSKVSGRTYSTKYQYAEIVDSDSKRMQAIHSWMFEWHFDLTKNLGLDVGLLHDFFEYDDPQLDGPSSATSLSADLYDELPLNFVLGLKVYAQHQSQNLKHDLPTYGDVSADGQTYTGKLYLSAEPVDWFGITVSTVVQKTKWQVEPTEAQETYEKNTPDFQQEFTAEAVLNLLF